VAVYVALIRKKPRSDYGVDFPDFPGCVSAGRTLDEAMTMAHEALAGHVAFMVEEGEKLPAPSRLETILRDPHNKGAVPFLVLRAGRSVEGGPRERNNPGGHSAGDRCAGQSRG
jgi:predicted RNase H-like HicB family nuclease